MLKAKVRAAYRAKDMDFPVQVGLATYLPEKVRQDRRPDRDRLFHWALQRLSAGAAITEEFIRTESRAKIRDALLALSRAILPAADLPEIDAKLKEIFSGAAAAEEADAREIVDWCKAELKIELDAAKLTGRNSL